MRTTPEGLYALTDEGKEALRIVSVSKESASDRVQNGKKLVISRAVLAGLVAALLLLASVAVIQELELTDFGSKQSSQNQLPNYQLVPLTSSAPTGSGLELQLSILNTAFIKSGESIAFVVSIYNPTDEVINVTTGSSWAPAVMRDIGIGQLVPSGRKQGLHCQPDGHHDTEGKPQRRPGGRQRLASPPVSRAD